jgi:hypothetical protein
MDSFWVCYIGTPWVWRSCELLPVPKKKADELNTEGPKRFFSVSYKFLTLAEYSMVQVASYSKHCKNKVGPTL